jgi:hypothetical protein
MKKIKVVLKAGEEGKFQNKFSIMNNQVLQSQIHHTMMVLIEMEVEQELK